MDFYKLSNILFLALFNYKYPPFAKEKTNLEI